MKRKILVLLLAAIMTLSIFSACGAKPEGSGTAQNDAEISFVDDDGNQISLDAPAERIISFYSAHTENLYSLGAGDKLIGGHTTCVYPAEAAEKAIYDYKGDPEYVIAAQPDVVVIRPHIARSTPEYFETLKNAGIIVVSLYPESFDDFPQYIEKLALLTGTQERADELLEKFYEDLNAIHELTSLVDDKQTVFFEATEQNIRTVAEGSMPDRAIEYAGGINLAEGAKPMTEGSSIAEFGEERVLALGDEIDVYVSQRGAMNSGGNLISIGERPGFDTVKAVEDGRVFLINEKLISSPTFRYYKGVNELARFMYPELLDDTSVFDIDEPATRRQFASMVVRTLHIPVYVPSSSKYYREERDTHTYGMFEDVHWQEEDFDYIETAVYTGYLSWRKGEDGLEYFDPDTIVTREELAKTVFIAGDFSSGEAHKAIADLDSCENARIVQTLVDCGVFELTADGCFEPQRELSCREVLSALAFINK